MGEETKSCGGRGVLPGLQVCTHPSPAPPWCIPKPDVSGHAAGSAGPTCATSGGPPLCPAAEQVPPESRPCVVTVAAAVTR